MFSAATKSAKVAGAVAANYIEQVFSTYLYTAAGATQNVNNGVDLSTKGGLLWIKARTSTGIAGVNMLMDSVSGFNKYLISDQTTQQQTFPAGDVITATTTGFSVPNNTSIPYTNYPPNTYASWTFRKQAKFFDIVTYTGNGGALSVSHALASQPGAIFIKRTDSTSNWFAFCATGSTYYASLYLNLTNSGGVFNLQSTYASSTSVNIGAIGTNQDAAFNVNGATYVMYLFASNAGGFGLTGTDNVISCGSWTGITATVNLGYEAQWVLVKRTDNATVGGWYIFDIMRGASYTTGLSLSPNTSTAELDQGGGCVIPTATGFNWTAQAGLGSGTFIYIAIRRGPMQVPTSGTSVFKPDYNASFPQPGTVTTNFVADWDIYKRTDGSSTIGGTRLTAGNYLFLSDTSAETSGTNFLWANNTGFTVQALAASGSPTINWAFARAPKFFDVVCYTGTGSATTQSHNLGVVPEMIIVKKRDATAGWPVYHSALGNTQFITLNENTAPYTSSTYWNNTSPTTTNFSIGTASWTNSSSNIFVAYLFASCPGVSKVGSYTGTGATQTISCGFTGGARFVLIKRTDTTGDWYVWDTARGMTSGTDPYLLLNTTAVQVNANNVYTATGGFQIVSSLADINANGGSYIFLAIA